MRRTSRLIPLVLALAVGLGVYLTAQQGAGGAGHERLLASSGQALRQWDDRITAMERTREMRLRAVQADGLVAGRSHERLDQYYRGVRVEGGEVVRETDGKVTLSVTASVYSGIRVDTDPALSPDAAMAVFLKDTGATSAPRAAPELVVLPRGRRHVRARLPHHRLPGPRDAGGLRQREHGRRGTALQQPALPAGDRANRHRRAGQPGARAERPEEGRVRRAGRHLPRLGHGPPDRHQDVRPEGQPDEGEGHLRREDPAADERHGHQHRLHVDRPGGGRRPHLCRLDLRLLLHAARLEGAEQPRQPHRVRPRPLGEPRRLHEVHRRGPGHLLHQRVLLRRVRHQPRGPADVRGGPAVELLLDGQRRPDGGLHLGGARRGRARVHPRRHGLHLELRLPERVGGARRVLLATS